MPEGPTIVGAVPPFALAPGEFGDATLTLHAETSVHVTARSATPWLLVAPETVAVEGVATLTVTAEGPRAPAGYRQEGTLLLSWEGGGRLVRITVTTVAPSERAVALAAEGVALARHGDVERARALLERSLTFAPTADGHLALGYLAYREGRSAEARHYLQAAHKLSPHDGEAAHWLGLLHLEDGALDDARRYLRDAMTQGQRTTIEWRFAAPEASRVALEMAGEPGRALRRLTPRRWPAIPLGALVVAALVTVGGAALALTSAPAPPPLVSLPAAEDPVEETGSGMLRITSDPPGAVVTLDGRQIGRTPLRVLVEPGPHTVVVAAAGLPARRRAVSVSSGETTEVALRLRPQQAMLRIASEPSGARVVLNGRARGTTPLDLEVPPGTVRVVVERGDSRWAGEVPLEPGEVRTLLVTLPLPALARVEPTTVQPPQPGSASFRDGLRLLDQGWNGPAIAKFREATRLDPKHALSHFYLGVALARVGRDAEARAAFETVQRLAPGTPLAAEAARLLAALSK